MDPSHYPESCYPAQNGFGSLQPHAIDFDFEPHRLFNQYPRNFVSHHVPADHPLGMLPIQYTTGYNTVFPAQGNWPQLPPERGPLVCDGLTPVGSVKIPPQYTYPSYAERAVQTTRSGLTSESNNGQWGPQVHRRPAPRMLVRQEIYRSIRHHTEFVGSKDIEFIVDGEEGIRLSDALEGKWAGFEGWDDSSLFGGNRLQIIIRLQFVGCIPWESKIPTTDFTARRRPITRMKLAIEVAKRMRKLITREKLNGHGGGRSQCGWGDLSLENVFLTRMVHVSAASWQPHFSVEQPSTVSQAASSSSSSPNLLA